MTQFYAYVHAKPSAVDAAGIFYVGKGHGSRARYFERNRYYNFVVAKHGQPIVGVIPCSSEKIALDLEQGLIKCLSRMKVKLTNLTSGGEGCSLSEETKQLISEKTKQAMARPEVLKKMSVAQKGRKVSADTRGKISVTHRAGMSAERKELLRQRSKAAMSSPEARLKVSNQFKGIAKKKVQCPHCQKIGGKI
ncbi:MAG: intron associated endonuclease 1 [Caudovirales sp. ctOwN3]|nr:MAG: intron associated endonuclease 1 [Caudovirales sp. ctOwN3]